MSFKVVMKGAPTRRLTDIRCEECGDLVEDVWKDEFEASDKKCQVCENLSMVAVLRAPHNDFHDTKPIFIPGFEQGHQHFSSHLAAERYAKAHNKTIIPNASKWEQLPVDTPEERINRHEKETGARQKALDRAGYRLSHGYKDHKSLEKE
jgi:hypothetical protein